MTKAEKILAELKRKKIAPEKVVAPSDFLSCGLTLGNLAMSGRPEGAWCKGGYYHLVGVSDSGKSWLTLATFAEASINPVFKDYRFIHDKPEKGTNMDFDHYFGKAMADRIEPPRGTRQDPRDSESIADFYYNLDDALKAKRPCIYVLDSMDAVFADPDVKKFKAAKNASRKTGDDKEEVKGSYGMAKAKANAEGMRIAYSKLETTGSILIIIGQAKVDMNPMSPPGSLTYAGGTSLKFYAHGQMWTRNIGEITKKIGEKTKQQGIRVAVEASKNRHNGRHSKFRFPIYWGTGMDETGSMVDWLTDEGRWKMDDKKVIKAKELEMNLPREELIQAIENDNAEEEVRKIVVSHWETIRLALIPQRKMKYNPQPEVE